MVDLRLLYHAVKRPEDNHIVEASGGQQGAVGVGGRVEGDIQGAFFVAFEGEAQSAI